VENSFSPPQQRLSANLLEDNHAEERYRLNSHSRAIDNDDEPHGPFQKNFEKFESVQFIVDRMRSGSADSDASSFDASEDQGVSSFEGGHSRLSTPQDPPALGDGDLPEDPQDDIAGGGSSLNSNTSKLDGIKENKKSNAPDSPVLPYEKSKKKALRDLKTVSEEIRDMSAQGTVSRAKQMFQSQINMNKSVLDSVKNLDKIQQPKRMSAFRTKSGFSLSLPKEQPDDTTKSESPQQSISPEENFPTPPSALVLQNDSIERIRNDIRRKPSINPQTTSEVKSLASMKQTSKFRDMFQSKINAEKTNQRSGSLIPKKTRTTRITSTTALFGGVRNHQTLAYKAITLSLRTLADNLHEKLKSMSEEFSQNEHVILRDTKLHADADASGENHVCNLKIGDVLEVTKRRMLSKRSLHSERVDIATVIFDEIEGYVKTTTFRGQIILCPNKTEIVEFASRVTEFVDLKQIVEKLLSDAVKNKRVVTEEEIMSACSHGRPENLEDLRKAIDDRLVKEVPKSSSPIPRLRMGVNTGSVKTHAEKYRSLSVQGSKDSAKKEMETLRKNSCDRDGSRSPQPSPRSYLPAEVKRSPSTSIDPPNTSALPEMQEREREDLDLGLEEEVLPATQTNEELKLDAKIESIDDVALPRVSTLPPNAAIEPVDIAMSQKTALSAEQSSDSSRVNPQLVHSKTMPILTTAKKIQNLELQSRSATVKLSKPPPKDDMRKAKSDSLAPMGRSSTYQERFKGLMGGITLSDSRGDDPEFRHSKSATDHKRKSSPTISLHTPKLPTQRRSLTPTSTSDSTRKPGKLSKAYKLLGETEKSFRMQSQPRLSEPARKKKKIETLPSLTLCSPEDIVNRCTHPEISVNEYKHVLLLCHSAFISTEDLLKSFLVVYLNDDVEHYFIDNEDEETRNHCRPILRKNRKLKVVIMIKYWMLNFPEDFRDKEIQEQASKVITRIVQEEGESKKVTQLREALTSTKRKSRLGSESAGTPGMRSAADDTFPIPKIKAEVINKNMVDIMTVSCEEIARQLCLADFEIFRRIEPREFIGQHWVKRKHLAPNVAEMINQFNKINFWVQHCILSHSKVNKRAECLARLLRVCTYLEKMNNLNSLAAINAGLRASAIHRLKKTFKRLNSAQKALVERYGELFSVSSNYKALRERTKTLAQPAIPHLALFLTDLTFIEDGNKDTKQGQINIRKYQLLSERIEWIRMFQQCPMHFKHVRAVHKYFKETQKVIPEEFLYTLSLQFEPRGA